MGYTAIHSCRIGGGANLIPVLDLGKQALTGVFPKDPSASITTGPLQLVWCPESGLLQLAHSYDLAEMYGDNYGYRSGLNQSMVRHLTAKIHELERLADLRSGDAVLDIGSNDATSLKAYASAGLSRTGMDPTGRKFSKYYTDGITLVPDFFSAKAYFAAGGKPAKIVTSIAMFYDLESPIDFARQVEEVLAPGGVWHFEQSYMPSMLRLTSYDTVCHEHLEYYSLGAVQRILAAAGMRAVDVKMNAINGGSFAVTAVRRVGPAARLPACHRMAAEPGGADGHRHAEALSRFRGARLPTPRRPYAPVADIGGGRQDRDRLWRFDQRQCGPAVLWHNHGGSAGGGRGEPGQVRRLHAGHQHSYHF